MKIAVVYSLPTRRARTGPFIATEEDTRQSALEVFEALKEKGAQPFLVPIAAEAISEISTLAADCIFNLIEWTGLDLPLSLQALDKIEKLGVPWVGADRVNFERTSDKIKMKQALDGVRLPTARWQLFATGDEPMRQDLVFPIIIKLAWEHCSIGLSRDAVVANPIRLPQLVKKYIGVYKQPVFVEEFIAGREIQVTLIEETRGVLILPPAEIVFTDRDPRRFLTYEGRWQEEHADFKASKVVVSRLSAALRSRLFGVCRKTFVDLGFHDYARFDLRLRDNDIFILETNSNPGLGDDDEYSMTISYKAAGLTFADFVWKIVDSCLRRFKPTRQ